MLFPSFREFWGCTFKERLERKLYQSGKCIRWNSRLRVNKLVPFKQTTKIEHWWQCYSQVWWTRYPVYFSTTQVESRLSIWSGWPTRLALTVLRSNCKLLCNRTGYQVKHPYQVRGDCTGIRKYCQIHPSQPYYAKFLLLMTWYNRNKSK